MKSKISHAVLMDQTYCLPSLLWRIVKISSIAPCPHYFLFVNVTNALQPTLINTLSSTKSLSTVQGNEKVPVSTLDLRSKETQRTILKNQAAFSRVNIVFFSKLNDVFRCFSIEEMELAFLFPNETLLSELSKHSILITPSLAMTPKVSELFYENGVLSKYAEYFRETIYIKGAGDATIHVKRSILSQELSTPKFDQDLIDQILKDFFGESPNDFSDHTIG